MAYTFLTGGARSGKSSLAVRLAESQLQPVLFIATAEALDEEMLDRIDRHKAERRSEWVTVEAPMDIASAILHSSRDAFIILDCLSLWVSNLLLAEVPDIAEQAADAANAMRDRVGVVVTNEVGMGIVPDNALARRYRDELGRVNTVFATAANEAFLVISGHTIRLDRPSV